VGWARDATHILLQISKRGMIDPSACVGPLVTALDHEDRDVQARAAEVLGKIGDTRAAAPLVKAFTDTRRPNNFRRICALSLGELGDPIALEPLARTVSDYVASGSSDRQVFEMAEAGAEALGGIPGQRAFELLLQLLQAAQNTWIRRAAVRGLGRTGSSQAVRPLLESCSDPDISEVAVDGLVALLAAAPESIPKADLQSMAVLKELTQNEYQHALDDDGGRFVAGRHDVDCSHLRRLAQEALSRRRESKE